jgi:hypothetical protein
LSRTEDDEWEFSYMEEENTLILEEVINLYDSDNVLEFQQT